MYGMKTLAAGAGGGFGPDQRREAEGAGSEDKEAGGGEREARDRYRDGGDQHCSTRAIALDIISDRMVRNAMREPHTGPERRSGKCTPTSPVEGVSAVRMTKEDIIARAPGDGAIQDASARFDQIAGGR
ncbi:hypothetical protein [Rhodobacter sp. 24-YEA-8]|uniref:hypothetical protein n=1 Tax=Rhodobacter sp. 24-YEA-8 TaxID=1884310 RepID=UPI00115F7AF0|nr:hypothetical protein [Rhodobacter sp. 24-YEA-8]